MDNEIHNSNFNNTVPLRSTTNTIKKEPENLDNIDESIRSLTKNDNMKLSTIYNIKTELSPSEICNRKYAMENIETIYVENTINIKEEEYEDDENVDDELPIYETITNLNSFQLKVYAKCDEAKQYNTFNVNDNKEVESDDIYLEFSNQQLFSETVQCKFCKIHLEQEEYLMYHISNCCQKNTGGDTLPTLKDEIIEVFKGSSVLGKDKKQQESGMYENDLKDHTDECFDVKAYSCGICHKKFKQKETLIVHVNNVHLRADGKGSYQCFVCEHKTHLKIYFKTHIDTKHRDVKMFECLKCEFKTNSADSLQRHLYIHKKVKQLNCSRCDYRTHRKDRLKNHLYIHETTKRFKCSECTYETNYKVCLKAHIGAKHCTIKKFKCMECDFETAYNHSLKSHLYSHEKVKKFKCSKCEFQTNDKWHLKVHMKAKHCEAKLFKCGLCEFETSYRYNLRKHLITHDSAKQCKQFRCSQCDFKTNYKPSLKEHINAKHCKIKKFKCSICEFETAYRYSLKKHVSSHDENGKR